MKNNAVFNKISETYYKARDVVNDSRVRGFVKGFAIGALGTGAAMGIGYYLGVKSK